MENAPSSSLDRTPEQVAILAQLHAAQRQQGDVPAALHEVLRSMGCLYEQVRILSIEEDNGLCQVALEGGIPSQHFFFFESAPSSIPLSLLYASDVASATKQWREQQRTVDTQALWDRWQGNLLRARKRCSEAENLRGHGDGCTEGTLKTPVLVIDEGMKGKTPSLLENLGVLDTALSSKDILVDVLKTTPLLVEPSKTDAVRSVEALVVAEAALAGLGGQLTGDEPIWCEQRDAHTPSQVRNVLRTYQQPRIHRPSRKRR